MVVEYGDATARRDIKSCWATWSRCSSWSSIATGILWLRCDICCKCMGRAITNFAKNENLQAKYDLTLIKQFTKEFRFLQMGEKQLA
jgi:hypothetical protein